MKKTAFIFLALSVITFGAAGTTGGENVSTTENSSTINVNVSATVFEELPGLIITDALGAPISSVNFEHLLKVGAVTGQEQETLTTSIRARGAAIQTDTLSKLSTSFGNNTLTLNNTASPTNNLTSTLTSTPGSLDTHGAIFNISSKLAGDAALGTYNTQTTTLTITYNKTK